ACSHLSGAREFESKTRSDVMRTAARDAVPQLRQKRTTMIKAAASENASRTVEPGVTNDPRWARVLARDRTADGTFWYSVVTTGVYCRPSCPSRTANPKNVQLHDTLADAKATGFRPCQRCNPDGPSIEAKNAALVAQACRMIEESEEE